MAEDTPWKTDKEGRIIDKQGRPLREHRFRNHSKAPFRGDEGKPHPRSEKLETRRKAYDELKEKGGRKRPGSLTK